MKTPWVAAMVLGGALVRPAGAQDAGEFQANVYTTGSQLRPKIALLGKGGDFVAVWESAGQDGDGSGVFARRVTPTALGAEFQVNVATAGDQTYPAVAGAPDGGFLVVWESDLRDGDHTAIVARRFAADGTPATSEFVVNTYTTWYQNSPAVAAGPDGTYLVAWSGQGGQEGGTPGIVTRRIGASGAPMGGEVRVNTYTTSAQVLPSVAAQPDGWVVVWSSYRQDGSGFGVYGQRLDREGAPRGAEFRLSAYTTSDQLGASVGSGAAGGGFVAAWSSRGQDGDASGVFARRFDAAGSALGAEFQVNTTTSSHQVSPVVGVAEDGTFVVAWAGDVLNQHPDEDMKIFSQRFEADGTPRGAEMRIVNTWTSYDQVRPALAADAVGNYAVVWDTTTFQRAHDVFVHRLGWLVPVALDVDPVAVAGSDGNGVMEPGEPAVFAPTWLNVSLHRHSPLTHLARFDGPPGGYEIIFSDSDYGTLDHAEAGRCEACAQVRVSGPRPSTHWDALAEERHLDFLAARKRWSVHVGDSFADVGRASPFYAFVETLLHRGVTAGCAPSRYCPAEATSRAQMTALVLLAREGRGYQPPACAAPPFADVPTISPFCPFVQELARRGVVAGCAAGQFCPAAPVTREQMALFVLATLDPAFTPPPCATPLFTDVPAASTFCPFVEELARRGVVAGCAAGRFCPAEPVTRAQVAVFVSATFGLVLYGP
jgi:hypothetical protein